MRTTTRAVVTTCALSAAVLVASCGDVVDAAAPRGPADRPGPADSRTVRRSAPDSGAATVPDGRGTRPHVPAEPDASDSVFGSPTDVFGG